MAIDSRIILAGRSPDIGAAFSNALLNVQRGQQIAQTREQSALNREQFDLKGEQFAQDKEQSLIRNRLLEAQTEQVEQGVIESEQVNNIRSLALFGRDIAGDTSIESIRAKTLQRITDVTGRGGDPRDSQELLATVIDNPDLTDEQKLAEVRSLSRLADNAAVQVGALKPLAGAGGLASAKTEILADGSVVQALPNGEVQVRNPAGEIVTGQDRLDVLSKSRQTGIAQRQLESDIKVEAEGKKVAVVAKATAKSAESIAKTRAFINTQVKLAEKAANERGDVLTDLSRMQAALPGLTDVVGKLRELAPIATSTIGGRLFDVASKELGFGATKGATAATKFGAMVNNQILPLLKPTFGGSFSVQEGQELKATMGDKNLSIDEKLATLDAFIEQKQRDIEAKQLQLDGDDAGGADTGVIMVDAQGNRARVFKDGRVEEL